MSELATWCQRHGTDAAAVTEALCRQMADHVPGGCICLSGSVIEGMGNARSDLDAYVLTDAAVSTHAAVYPDAVVPSSSASAAGPAAASARAPVALTFGNAQIVRVGTITIDIEYVPLTQLDALVARMAGYPARALRDQRGSAVALSQGELKLMHNILLAIPVPPPVQDQLQGQVKAHGPAKLQQLQAQIDPAILARLLFDRCSVLIDAVQQDVIGFIEARDRASAIDSLRTYRLHVAGAFLAALGMTNPAEKWRALKMRQAASHVGAHVLPGGRTVADIVGDWCASDAALAGTAPVHSLMTLSMLANTILPWGLQRFADGLPNLDACPTATATATPPATTPTTSTSTSTSTSPAPAPAPALDGDVVDAPCLPVLAWDCAVRRDATGTWLARLGAAQRLYVDALGLETVLQFSGRTSPRTALRRLARISDAAPAALARSIADFHQVLAAQHLVIAPGLLPC